MKILAYFIGLIILLSASECSKKDVALAGTRWKVAELRQANATTAQLPTKDYILEFRDETSVRIKLDINSCGGAYEIVTPGKIKISPLACTKACCDSEFAMQTVSMLSQMTAFKMKKDVLFLEGEGKIRLELVK